MTARTDHAVDVAADIETVWSITNDLRRWPELFSEYASVEILEERPAYVRFRLTMHPDEQGRVWSWVSERELDHDAHVVVARRVETGPFEFMDIRWEYTALDASTTRMRWSQEFAMKPTAPVDDEQMARRIDTNTPREMARIAAFVERSTPAGTRS